LALLPAGVTWPPALLQMPVVFYTTFSPSPLAPRGASWLFVSVALFRQVSSSRRVPRPGCYPTPCSVECGLSSIPTTQDRDRPTVCQASVITDGPVSSYLAFSTLPIKNGRYVSVVLSPDHSGPPLAATLSCGVRTFLPPLEAEGDRSTGRLKPLRQHP
jgi:hypothetical protein